MKHLFLLVILLISFAQIASAQIAPAQNDGVGVWTTTYTTTTRIWGLAVDPVTPANIYIASYDAGIFKSTDAGATFNAANTGLTYTHLQCITICQSNPSVLYVGTDSLGGSNSGVYKTTNGGTSWTFASSGITGEMAVQTIAVNPANPNIVWCGVFNGLASSTVGLWKTTNGGTSWAPSNTGMTNFNILSLAVNPLNPNVVYAGSSLILPASTGPTTIYRTNNGGTSWAAVVNGLPQTSTDNNPVRCLSVSNADTSVVLAGLFLNAATGGMYLTTNGGQQWMLRHSGIYPTTGTLIRCCIIKPGSSTEMYAGIDRATASQVGIFRTTDAGLSWTDFTGGTLLNTFSIRAVAFKLVTGMHTLYAGESSTATASGHGLFEYSWIVSGISNGNSGVPDNYSLSQNYPNPFNPVTQINYALRKDGIVTLKIYDMTGSEVSTLVNEYQQAGYHNVEFNGANLSSGTYFYRITSNDFTATKKMVLLK